MYAPGKPQNELQRLAALIECRLLDTEQEPAFDAIVRAASCAVSAPIALFSLVDEERQWFKARVNLDTVETPRDQAFCAYAVFDNGTLVVPDTHVDERFADNPLVRGAPHIRSYLGAPVRTKCGASLGTICVIDRAVRDWSEHDVAVMESFAAAVSEMVEQRKSVLRAESVVAEMALLSQELDRARAWAEEVSEVAGVGGWELDLRTNNVTWSEKTRCIHEVSDSYVPELETAIDFYAPEAVPMVQHYVQRATETGEGWDFELPLITARKRRVWVRSIGRCIFEGGEPVRVQGTFQDITAQRSERDALENALKRADKALSNLSAYQIALDEHSIVAITDELGNIKFANDKFCEISGYERAELVGQNHRMLNSGHHPRAFFVEMWRTIGRGDPWHGVICNKGKNGELYWVDTTIVPLKGDDGKPNEYVAVRFDITDRVRYEGELVEEKARAEAATEAKGQFLANMSHEIRTPLNGVVGVVDALARTDLSERQRDMVRLIQSSGETLERLLSDILDFSKIEAGRLDLHTEPFDLRQSVEAAAGVMRAKAEEKGVRFEVVYGPNADTPLRGDAVRIKQVVANLASNAVKFTEKGGVIVKVDVDDIGAKSLLRIEVEDSGIGFDEETGKRLFTRFEQADGSITRSFGGTGLGLSICRALAEMMDGEVYATSDPGVGSRFVFTARLERALEERRGARREDADDATLDFSKLRVLVAEDHPINRQVVALLMEPMNVKLQFAENGAEAVEAVENASFDVILMDMQMPVMDGLEATRVIRARQDRDGKPPTPIIMLSANAMKEHIELSAAAGCDAHVPKPLTAEILVDGLRLAMEKRANLPPSGDRRRPRLRAV